MREPKTHVVKSWSYLFQAINSGLKMHDIRKNDRDYCVGDYMHLLEYDNTTGQYTGKSLIVEITYITDNRIPCAFSSAVLQEGYSVLSVKRCWEAMF